MRSIYQLYLIRLCFLHCSFFKSKVSVSLHLIIMILSWILFRKIHPQKMWVWFYSSFWGHTGLLFKSRFIVSSLLLSKYLCSHVVYFVINTAYGEIWNVQVFFARPQRECKTPTLNVLFVIFDLNPFHNWDVCFPCVTGRTLRRQSECRGQKVTPARTSYPKLARCPPSPRVRGRETPSSPTPTTHTPPRRHRTPARWLTPTSCDPETPARSRDSPVTTRHARRHANTSAPPSSNGAPPQLQRSPVGPNRTEAQPQVSPQTSCSTLTRMGAVAVMVPAQSQAGSLV